MTHPFRIGTLAGMNGTHRALVTGALLGALLAAAGSVIGVAACVSPAERRALTVADCVARLALALPDRDFPRSPGDLTGDDLVLAVAVLDGVRACRRGGALFTVDGGF